MPGVELNVAYDSAITTSAAIIHRMPMLPLTFESAVDKCSTLILHLQKSHTAFYKMEDCMPTDPTDRRTFYVFALLYSMYLIAADEPACLEYCTLMRESCPLAKKCPICKKRGRERAVKITILSLHSLSEAKRRSIRALMVNASQAKMHQIGETEALMQSDTRMVSTKFRANSATVKFITQAQICINVMWRKLIAPNFLLLQFHMRMADVLQDLRPPPTKRHKLPEVPVVEPEAEAEAADEARKSPTYAPASPIPGEPTSMCSPTYDNSAGNVANYPPSPIYDQGRANDWESDNDADIDGLRIDGSFIPVIPGTLL